MQIQYHLTSHYCYFARIRSSVQIYVSKRTTNNQPVARYRPDRTAVADTDQNAATGGADTRGAANAAFVHDLGYPGEIAGRTATAAAVGA